MKLKNTLLDINSIISPAEPTQGFVLEVNYKRFNHIDAINGFMIIDLESDFRNSLEDLVPYTIHPDNVYFTLTQQPDFLFPQLVLKHRANRVNDLKLELKSVRLERFMNYNNKFINTSHTIDTVFIESINNSAQKDYGSVTLNELALLTADGNTLQLPSDTELTKYKEIKSLLLKAGGKYSRNTFIFKSDAHSIQTRILSGEKINTKQQYQVFETPTDIGKVAITKLDIQDSDRVCEPSAGRGRLAKLARALSDNLITVEIFEENVNELKANGFDPIHSDFLKLSKDEIGLFDKIIANPPFTKNQDIDHIRHMFELLKPNGRLTSFASTSWQGASSKKQKDFIEWLKNHNAEIQAVPAGAFKESGTSIATTIITITKAA
ncbi:class I SAM-dependent methyltransferase [Vibrio breoganii]